MAKKKFKKPILLQEEFAAGEVSNPNQNATPVVQTDTNTVGIDKTANIAKSGEEVRAEIIKDVDSILTNLETLSKNLNEDLDFFLNEVGEPHTPLNENFDQVIASFLSKAAVAKGMGMMKKYGELKLAANSNVLDSQKFERTKAIDQKLRKLRDVKDNMKDGPGKEKAIANIQKLVTAKSDADSTFELAKEKAANKVAEVDEKLKKLESKMAGKEKEIYDTKKREINANVAEQGLELKAQRLKAQGKEDAAKEAAADLGKMKSTNAEMRSTIKELEKESKDMGDIDGQITRTEADLKLAKKEMDADRAKSKKAGEEFDEKPYKDAIQSITNQLISLKDQKAKSNKDKKNESEELEEGNAFGAARAEAIAKGEKTFKVGDEEYDVEDVDADDKENAEEFVEEAKEELPKKIELYEGMSVADRFKALM